ncbi:AraC family transcriptional regulator [Chitinispirillales bacterium ANBcel5]|uniref:helix-turn-helix domain-containing protein n=1 Tax=Cellulosispirillum alkaliphilum TaxID=3039283 RepID=UPI002A4FABD7|nr:AraC family transcriptional regulator [Chitinispirillales bacterium ANBcel5]
MQSKRTFSTLILLLLVCITQAQFPPGEITWSAFDDNHESGNSKVLSLSVTDSVEWVYQLNPGHSWPFAGLTMGIDLTQSNSQDNCCNESDTLIIYMRSNQPGRVVLQLATFDPEITVEDDPVSSRTLEAPVTVFPEKTRVAVPLEDFKVAKWWRTRYGIAPTDKRLFLDSINVVNWVFGNTPRIGHTDTLVVYGVSFVSGNEKKRSSLMYLLFIVPLFFIPVLIKLLTYKRKEDRNEGVSKVINLKPEPLEVQPGDWDRFLQFMNKNYSSNELNLSNVASSLGISESRLSKLIKENYHEGFRSMIHTLRIDEAKRLLSHTKLNVAEIAYKLGYATPSHFNREFKLRIGVTPTAFRAENSTLLSGSTL